MRYSQQRRFAFISRWLIVVMMAFGILSCASNDKPSQADLNNIASPQQWLDLALQAKEPERSEYRLNATRLYLRSGRLDLASSTLTGTKPTDLANQQHWLLLDAQLKMAQGDMVGAEQSYDSAIEQPLLNKQLNDVRYAIATAIHQYHEDYWGAAQQAVKRYPYVDVERQAKVEQQIWSLLAEVEKNQPSQLANQSVDPAFDGWLSLYKILNNKGQLQQVLAQLQQWQQAYKDHPASATLPANLNEAMTATGQKPADVAVILPLSGKYKSQGHALRNGMLQAVLDDLESPTQLHFYDSGRNTIADLYQQIQQDGHSIIVGPLLKPNVRTLLEIADESMQVLALNQVDDDQQSAAVSSFALSPELEGSNTATFFIDQGIEHPLVLQANGSSYQRITRSFEQAWQQQENPNSIALVPIQDAKNMQKQVQQIMGITDSKARAAQLAQALGLKLESEPRSRADIDAIYVVASSQQARLLKSFVDVTISPFADPVKVYAGPRSHNGQSSEFGGIYIADIPLLTDQALQQQKTAVQTLAPEWQYSDIRLFAMGHDALSLIPQLEALRQLPGFTVSGWTGDLSVSEKGEVGVSLPWSRYQDQRLIPVSS
ncbi:penicillin-binding protein activator [Neiella marina]|uniref:Penicillin-binding protein activator n=1 Tax=Neiella marina TaxID=508461 RepID=A0A8J2U6Z9_9GAMM|nr:penicillin-binding protein activator [Neiella marina]GGA83368.1 penicillin-binding protein activator [Neiella marina]